MVNRLYRFYNRYIYIGNNQGFFYTGNTQDTRNIHLHFFSSSNEKEASKNCECVPKLSGQEPKPRSFFPVVFEPIERD